MPFTANSNVSLYYNVAGEGPAVCLINRYRLSSFAWPAAFINPLLTRSALSSSTTAALVAAKSPIQAMNSPIWRPTSLACSII